MLTNGYVLKYKLKDGTWITIPVSYETMYEAYLTYCADNNIPITLSKEEYYTAVGTLKDIADAFAGEGALPLNKGGTGTSVTTVPELLHYLGLITSVATPPNPEDNNKFLSVAASDEVNKQQYDTITNEYTYAIAAAVTQLETDYIPKSNITYGTLDPDPNTGAEGAIYIKY